MQHSALGRRECVQVQPISSSERRTTRRARRGERWGRCSASGQFLASLPKRYWSSRLRSGIDMLHAQGSGHVLDTTCGSAAGTSGAYGSPGTGAGAQRPGSGDQGRHKIHQRVNPQTRVRKPACKHITAMMICNGCKLSTQCTQCPEAPRKAAPREASPCKDAWPLEGHCCAQRAQSACFQGRLGCRVNRQASKRR